MAERAPTGATSLAARRAELLGFGRFAVSAAAGAFTARFGYTPDNAHDRAKVLLSKGD